MKTLFHGTTRKGYFGIINEGFCSPDTIWKESSNMDACFYEKDLYAKSTKFCLDNDCHKSDVMAGGAVYNALISKALLNEPEQDIYIIELTMEDDVFNHYFDVVDECLPRMSLGVWVREDILNDAIIDGEIQIRIKKINNAYDSTYRIDLLCLANIENLNDSFITEELASEIEEKLKNKKDICLDNIFDEANFESSFVYDSQDRHCSVMQLDEDMEFLLAIQRQKKEVVLFHGTTEAGINGILTEGFGRSNIIWNCSLPDETCLYEVNKYHKYFDGDSFVETSDLPEVYRNVFFQGAVSNALISKAVLNELTHDVYVIEFHVPQNIYQDCFNDDYSCPNMEHASTVSHHILNKNIESGDIAIMVHKVKNVYRPDTRFAFISGMSRDLISTENFDEIDFAFMNADIDYPDEVYDLIHSPYSDDIPIIYRNNGLYANIKTI